MTKNVVDKVYCALELERKIVGVKFLYNEDEYLKRKPQMS